MRFLDYLKKFTVFDIIISILFIVINVLSIILFKWTGLLMLPILTLLILIYFNPDKIVILFKNIKKKITKKSNKDKRINKKTNTKKNNNKPNKKNGKNKINNNKKRKNKNYSVEEEFEDDDIILKEEVTDDIEKVYEVRDVDNVKKINKNSKSKKTQSKNKNKNKNKKKNKEKTNKKEKNKKKRSILKVLLSTFLIFCITCVLGVASFLTYIVVTTENFDPNKLTYQDQTKVYDKNGNVFATLGTEKRESVTYDKLPQVLVDAIIATEDSRFFQHNGVDFARFLKASVQQLLGQSSAGGASTLTMQVSKNNLTSRNSDGLEGIIRKFRDVYISVFQIEKKYTKEQIIEFYVNDNLLGGSNYGVEQASQYYFGKSVSELNLAEASTIAGIFQSPNKYRPDINPEAAETRRNLVLDLMVRHGYITKEEAEITKAISVESLVVASGVDETYKGFLYTVVDEVQDKTELNPYSVPMKIYTTLDPSIQNGIDQIMNGTTYTWQNEIVQAGIAVVDVDTGEIIAIGAGRNQENQKMGFNYATQAVKHPGSTAKPLFDYGPGFEYSNYSTYTLFNDEPWTYTNGPSVNNWNGTFDGLMTLKTALSQSRNIPALKAFQQNNKNNIQSFVNSLGITTENPLHEAHSIGGFTGVTPLEMAAAYAAFANGGYYIEPHTVTKIEYRDSGEIEEFKYTKERVMEASTAFMINNVLKYAVDTGYDGGSRVSGKTVAAKTGTSSFDDATIKNNGLSGDAVNDLWTVAYTPEYSFSLWYGYDELYPDYYNTNSTGGSYKNALMRQLVKVIPMTSKEFSVPDTVVQSTVEFGTWPAQLPSEYTPSELIVTEYFKKGTQPTETSQRFTKFSNVSNLETEKISNNTVEITWDYKMPEIFTETYLKKYFSQNVFGNGSDGFINQRLSYYGGVGFGIYIEDEDGNQERIDFTTDTKYKYTNTSNKDVYLVVKVQYKDYAGNASDGIASRVLVKGKGNSNNNNTDDNDENNNTSTESLLSANIKKSASFAVGKYQETSFTIEYNKRDVTNNATVYYNIKEQNISTNDKTDFVDKVNQLQKGTYTIEYQIHYKNEIATYKKTLTLT